MGSSGGGMGGGGMGGGMPNASAMISQPSDPTLKQQAGYNWADTMEPMTLISNLLGYVGQVIPGNAKVTSHTVQQSPMQQPQMQMPQSQDRLAFLRAFGGQ